MTTRDDDFLHVDLVAKGNSRLAIICHGLEGSSQSQYVRGITRFLSGREWDTAAVNFRGCSGIQNHQPRLYHSGATEDLSDVISYFLELYDELVLIGYSLGGNLVLKYCGEVGHMISSKIPKVVAVSVPFDLEAGCRQIAKKSNYLYQQNFLNSLNKKLEAKVAQFPGLASLKKGPECKTLYDFDNQYTAPIHGFKNAHDYYNRCSCAQYVPNIKISALVVNALDDPFLPEECYPNRLLASADKLTFLTPRYGGHVGFAEVGQQNYWIDRLIGEYIESGQAN